MEARFDIKRGLCTEDGPLERRLWRATRLIEDATEVNFEHEPKLIVGNTSLAYPVSREIEISEHHIKNGFRSALWALGHEKSHLDKGDLHRTDDVQERAERDAASLVRWFDQASPGEVSGYEMRQTPRNPEVQAQLTLLAIGQANLSEEDLAKHVRELAQVETGEWSIPTSQEVIDIYQQGLVELAKGGINRLAAREYAIEFVVDDCVTNSPLRKRWVKCIDYDSETETEIFEECRKTLNL